MPPRTNRRTDPAASDLEGYAHKIHPVAGLRGWVKEVPPYHLPDGLPDRTPVTVIGPANAAGIEVIVTDAEGRQWPLYHIMIDVGWRRYRGGRWIDDNDPEQLARVRTSLRALLASPPGADQPKLIDRNHAEQIRSALWRLERYGEDVSEFAAALPADA